MKWYIADKDYVKYLKTIDGKVQDIDYGNSLKPYLGILINVNGFNYYVPISSADKPHKVDKYSRMKNSKDFHKIIDSEDGKLLAVLNINNMIPIPNEYLINLKYEEIEKYKTFESEEKKKIYIDLLRKELKE
ncbi:MAG: type III toxin-antitoxin system ToxN/AbiQ family toxin, partial [Clostridiales bacterium]|nr:type III toxin-antitoxin system ToxN/AbiQ family toxin [Clostridiales bacterium]